MMENNYGISKKVEYSFEETKEKITNELKSEGFGILTEIDVKATLRKKLGVDFENYLILGACNPDFAYKALQAEREIGLLMPCNVIIYEKNSQVHVSIVRPDMMVEVTQNKGLEDTASQAMKKLSAALDRI